MSQLRSIDIQLSFPDEPSWEIVSLETLYELVEYYSIEQSCATSAICELHKRNDSRVVELCEWLLKEPNTDKWLKECASEILATNTKT